MTHFELFRSQSTDKNEKQLYFQKTIFFAGPLRVDLLVLEIVGVQTH